MPPAWELYETSWTRDCAKMDTVPVRNGIAEFDLPDEAVFMLVATLKEEISPNPVFPIRRQADDVKRAGEADGARLDLFVRALLHAAARAARATNS